MRTILKLVLAGVLAGCPLQVLRAQDLAPRAYLVTPLHSNAVILTWSFYDGSINFNGALPVSDAKGKTLLRRSEVENFKPKSPGPSPKVKQPKPRKAR